MKGKGLIQSRKHCLGLPEHLQASSPGVGGRAFTWERCTEGKLETYVLPRNHLTHMHVI